MTTSHKYISIKPSTVCSVTVYNYHCHVQYYMMTKVLLPFMMIVVQGANESLDRCLKIVEQFTMYVIHLFRKPCNKHWTVKN